MPVMKLLRQNPMLAAGILLPVAVVIFFVLATMIPRWLVDPPGYDFVFTSMQGSSTGPGIELSFIVEGDRVRARVYKTERSYRNVLRLFLFEHETQTVREIPVTLPADTEDFENGDYLEIPGLESRTVSTSRTAPDGYEVYGPDYRGGDFFPFYRTRGSSVLTLTKSGAVIEVPQVGGSGIYYYNATFLGWLTD